MSRSLCTVLLTMAAFLAGCRGPIADTSQFMVEARECPSSPPPGKSLVLFHRPRENQGHGLYFSVFDGHRLVADLGNGHTAYSVCEPGTHQFIGRSVEVKTITEAELRAGEAYDFVSETAGWWIASFRLEPLLRGDERRSEIPDWLGENKILVVQDSAAVRDYEQKLRGKIDDILREQVVEDGGEDVLHLSAEDGRSR